MLAKAKSLQTLYLSSNNLSGVITSDMLAKAQSLSFLDLSRNSLLSLSSRDHTDHVNYTFDGLNEVRLSSCNIMRFPSFLKTAKNLSLLDLSNNKIQGSISKWELEGWEALVELDLSRNSLTSIEQYPGQNILQSLDVSSNQLQGPLPSAPPPPSLQKLLMSNNNLTGEIPTSFCNLTSLGYLDLSTNNLGGTIPKCLAKQSWWHLDLQFNNFHGQIPAFDSGSLKSLALNDNQLEGLLPRSLVNCYSLALLDVANNKLNDTFPHWLGKLLGLQLLVLRSNRFHGSIEDAIAPSYFSSLEIIDLSQNMFTGTLPTDLLNFTAMRHPNDLCIWSCGGVEPYQSYVEVVIKRLQLKLKVGDYTTSFRLLDFSNNQFYGGIPKVLGELGSLLVLNLSHNHLNGSIPPILGHMAALESLDLSSNKLGGKIPPELTGLTFLEVLNLSHNNLIGPIPKGKQFDTFDKDSYIGNPGLWGYPLSKECHYIFKKYCDEDGDGDGDDDSGIIPFIWKVVAMGYIWMWNSVGVEHWLHNVHNWETMVDCWKD